MKRWIAKSFTSVLRKRRQLNTLSDATISSYSLATDLVTPRLKDRVRTIQSDNFAHDVCLPPETIGKTIDLNVTDSSGPSSPSSSSGGLADSESVTGSAFPGEFEGPPSLQVPTKRHCEECTSELKEEETCSCTPTVAIVPPSPLPSARVLSPVPSTSPEGNTFPIHTSGTGQIPDEKGVPVEIVQVNQATDSQHTGYTTSGESSLDPWGRANGNRWDEFNTGSWDEPQDPPSTPPTSASPLSVENDDVSPTLQSSDFRMTLTLLNFLGAGSYGKVVSAKWVEGGHEVAVKVSHKLYISELDRTEPGLRSLKNELDVLKALKQAKDRGEMGSNFFPDLFKSWQDTKNVYFVMDIYPWNLDNLRWADPTWDVTDNDKILWAAELILGVQALHDMRIIHRDIKPANVFVTSTKHLVIGDYGLAQAWLDPFYSKYPHTLLKARDAPGTMSYLSPEVVRGFYLDPVNTEVRRFTTHGFEADIWSLGVTICDSWSQCTGLFHLQETEEHLDYKSVIPQKILGMDVDPAVKRVVGGHPIWHLITRMLDRNPVTRIGFKEMYAHPVFAILDWNKVADLRYTPMWNFPKVETSNEPKPVKDTVEFTSYYKAPEDIWIDETDSERTQARKLEEREAQIIRRAMGAARDWMSNQWISDSTFQEYEFDFTAPEVDAVERRWEEDDD